MALVVHAISVHAPPNTDATVRLYNHQPPKGLMPLEMNKDVFWFATVLREPRARLISHHAHHNRNLMLQRKQRSAKRVPTKIGSRLGPESPPKPSLNAQGGGVVGIHQAVLLIESETATNALRARVCLCIYS